jgi:hypothetical protein
MTDPNSPILPAESAPTGPSSQPAALTAPPGTALQIAQMLAAGTIDTAQAGKLSKAGNLSTLEVARALNVLRAAGEPQESDGRSPEVRELDAQFPPAKESDYIIRYYTPGQEPPVMPKEVQAFDSKARGWMADAGLTRDLGNSLVTTLSKAIQQTHTMTDEQRESYKEQENEKLRTLFGGQDKLDAALEPARQMIHELDQKRPGLKEFVRAHGDHALFVAQLIQTARLYAKRKGP